MKLDLIHRKIEAEGVESFIFTPLGPLTWRAGQFMHYVLRHESADGRGQKRWFTISSAPSEKHVMVTTRFSKENGSTFKKALRALKVGESIEALEVEGDFVVDDPDQQYVFIAGGIGITPFRSILKEAENSGTKLNVTLLYANRSSDIPYKAELEKFAINNENLTIHHIVAPSVIDENAIRRSATDLSKPFFYVSGPEPMVESIGNMLKTMGIAKDHLRQDWFPGYTSE